jgi:hypothetical protein
MVTLCPFSFENKNVPALRSSEATSSFQPASRNCFRKDSTALWLPFADSELDFVLRLFHVFRIRGQSDGDFRHLVPFGQLGGLRCFRFRGGAELGRLFFYSAIELGDFRRALKTNRHAEVAATSAGHRKASAYPKERISALRRIPAAVASVRWRGDRLHCRRKREAEERQCDENWWSCFELNQWIHGLSFLFPARLILQLRVRRRRKTQRGKVLRLVSDPF